MSEARRTAQAARYSNPPGMSPDGDSATIAATGSTAADAAALTARTNLITAADGVKGVELPAAADATAVFVLNTSVDAGLNVYPVDGGNDNINALAEDAPFILGPGLGAWFISTSLTQWYVEGSAGIGAG